jgi:hypothetical protein
MCLEIQRNTKNASGSVEKKLKIKKRGKLER